MGLYNSYGRNPSVQLKVAEDLACRGFDVGDLVDLADGVYVGWGGFVVVVGGRLAGTWNGCTTSWGDFIDPSDVIRQRDPVTQAMILGDRKRTDE